MTALAALPTAFHFTVTFGGSTVKDAAFQEVSGLEAGYEVETVVEGGENRFVHRLPKPTASPMLTLKRAILTNNSGLAAWCKKTLQNDLSQPIEPMDLTIQSLDGDGEPLVSWSLTNAYPTKWEVGGFDAMKNELAVETIELAYATIKRK